MELILFENNKFQQLYNCTGFNISAVPFEKRSNASLGVFFIVIGVIEEILYIPCMIVIWRNMKHSCYKIMFYMGILDMLCLLVCAIATGWLCILGAIFCSYPTLIYWLGISINFFWPTESTIEVLLAVDRCMEIFQPKISLFLFKGYRTVLWMILITFYGVFMMSYVNAFIFNGMYSTWFFYPFFGYNNNFDLQLQYTSLLHDIHDWIIAVMVPFIYLLLGIYLFAKNKSFNLNTENSQQRKSVFLQVALISAINSFASIIYVYLPYRTDFSPIWALMAQFMWIQAHGFPPIIYLAINKTMRKECKELLSQVIKGKFQFVRTINTSITQNRPNFFQRNQVHVERQVTEN